MFNIIDEIQRRLECMSNFEFMSQRGEIRVGIKDNYFHVLIGYNPGEEIIGEIVSSGMYLTLKKTQHALERENATISAKIHFVIDPKGTEITIFVPVKDGQKLAVSESCCTKEIVPEIEDGEITISRYVVYYKVALEMKKVQC